MGDSGPRKEIQHFLAYTFIISWSITLTLALASRGIIQLCLPSNLTMLASFGPTLSVLLIKGREKGVTGITRFLRENLKPRMSLTWFLFVFLGPGAVGALSFFLSSFIRGVPPDFRWASGLSVFPIVFLFVFFLGGPLGEEYGWRGFALPRLLKEFGYLKANLFLGVIWWVWHLPLFFIEGTPQSQLPMLFFMLQILGTTFIYTWIMEATGGSVMAAMVFHASGNSFAAFIPFLPLDQTSGNMITSTVFLGLIWAIAFLVSINRLKKSV